jgi:hypothetical protein
MSCSHRLASARRVLRRSSSGRSAAIRRLLTHICWIAILFALQLFGDFAPSCWAQVSALGAQTAPQPTVSATTFVGANPLEISGGEYSPLALGTWLLHPALLAGPMYDDNINQTRTNQVASAGFRVVPSLLAQADHGIYKTTLYGILDGRAYFNGDAAGSIAANAGISQTYEAMPDLVFNVKGDYTRQKDAFDTIGSYYGMTNLNTTGVGLTPVANPQSYNQFAGSASVRKDWDTSFVTLTGSIVDIVYADTGSGSTFPSGVTYTATGRAGQWLVPSLYVFGEAAVDQRNYVTNALDSHGYRMVGGIGTDQIGLIRGEIYGGYQAELFDLAAFSNVDSAVFGGSLRYSPSHGLTLSASVDRLLGISQSAISPASPFGAATIVTTSLLKATYSIASEWSASARFGYIQTEYVGSPEHDNAWSAGATISHSVWKNLSVTLDYQFMQTSSNAWSQNFTRNVITLGASYKY